MLSVIRITASRVSQAAHGLVLAILVAPGLNVLALGDDVATALGTPVSLVRAVSILAATPLAAAAVGPIGLVGLAVPHLVRALVGSDHRWQPPCGSAAAPSSPSGTTSTGPPATPTTWWSWTWTHRRHWRARRDAA